MLRGAQAHTPSLSPDASQSPGDTDVRGSRIRPKQKKRASTSAEVIRQDTDVVDQTASTRGATVTKADLGDTLKKIPYGSSASTHRGSMFRHDRLLATMSRSLLKNAVPPTTDASASQVISREQAAELWQNFKVASCHQNDDFPPMQGDCSDISTRDCAETWPPRSASSAQLKNNLSAHQTDIQAANDEDEVQPDCTDEAMTDDEEDKRYQKVRKHARVREKSHRDRIPDIDDTMSDVESHLDSPFQKPRGASRFPPGKYWAPYSDYKSDGVSD